MAVQRTPERAGTCSTREGSKERFWPSSDWGQDLFIVPRCSYYIPFYFGVIVIIWINPCNACICLKVVFVKVLRARLKIWSYTVHLSLSLYIYVTQTLIKSERVSLLARRYQDFALWAPASRFLAWVSTEDWTPNSSTLCRCQISTNLSEVLLLGHINEVFCVLNSGWESSQAQRISSTGDLSLLGTRSFAACQEWVKLLVSSTVGVLWVSKWALIDLDIAYIIVKDVLVLAGPTCNVFLVFFTLSLSLSRSLFVHGWIFNAQTWNDPSFHFTNLFGIANFSRKPMQTWAPLILASM